ncbi:nuclear transport factor 2 family protein [Chloroflexota bacterium]
MTLEELEKRIGILEDTEKIKQLQIRYVNGLIRGEWDEVVDMFIEDGVADLPAHGVHKGRAEIDELFKKKVSRGHIGQEGDYVVHPLVSIDGDRATGNWLLYLQLPYPRKRQNGQETDWSQGYYDMEYVKINGEWKISSLKWTERFSALRPPYHEHK